MKKWLIAICCVGALAASIVTSGMTRSLIELVAFVSILALAWTLYQSQ